MSAKVEVESRLIGEIGRGLCVFVAVMQDDELDDAVLLAKKVVQLRIFTDEQDKMNLSIGEVDGSVLAVSQFTLAGDVRKGNRPSFVAAMQPEPARVLFDHFCENVSKWGVPIQTGQFRAHMNVELTNDGPVTLLLDTKRSF